MICMQTAGFYRPFLFVPSHTDGDDLVCCPTNSRPKTRRESAPCCVANPRQVSNLAVVRALPGADFASFLIGDGVLLTAVKAAFSFASVIPRTSGTGH